MGRKQTRRLNKRRSDTQYAKQTIEHIKKRAFERYGDTLTDDDVKSIQQIIKNAMKGKLENSETKIFSLRKVVAGKHILITYKNKFYRIIWNSQLNRIVTFIPLIETSESNNPDVQDKINKTNDKVQQIINNIPSQ